MPTNQIQAAWPLKKPQLLVYIELGPSNGGMMLGICEEGLSYRAVSPLISEGPISFAFALDGRNRLQGTGEIVWSEDGGKTGGLKFTNVSPQFRETLRVWLAGEDVPRNPGREVTPAVATPLDSLEKIKETVREKSVVIPEPPPAQKPEEPKKQFKPRDWSTPIAPVQKPPEPKPVEVQQAETKPIESKPIEVKAAEPKLVEAPSVEPPPIEKIAPANIPPAAPIVPPKIEPVSTKPVVAQASPPAVVEPPLTQAKPAETKLAAPIVPSKIEPVSTKPVVAQASPPVPVEPPETKPTEARPTEPEVIEPMPPQKSAADFFLHRPEPKIPEHLQSQSGTLPKLRLPFSPVPKAPEAIAPETEVAKTPEAPVVAAPINEPISEVPASPAEAAATPEKISEPETGLPTEEEVATALAAPGLLGLHEPKEFVPEEPSLEEESPYEFEPPRLNRAAATLIIGLAVAIIFGALVLSFRREVGEALVHFGQMLAGEEAKPNAAQPSSTSVAGEPEDDSYPPVAIPLKPANSQPQPTVSPSSTPSQTVRQVPEVPLTGGGNGQKEFEQARNILKGTHRQRDLPLAVSLLWTGADKGFVSAEVTLADLYARGDGVEKSCAQARVLLEAAIRKGSPEARRRLEQLKRQGCS